MKGKRGSLLNYVWLSLAALCVTAQNILKQKFGKKSRGGVLFFSGMIAVFACLFFVAVNRDFGYRPEQLLFSFGFAASYAVATVFAVLAMKHGSLAKTNLILSCSLLLPTFYGILFLGEKPSITLLIGVVILVASLVMTNYEKSKERATWKWWLFVLLSFAGNGMCSIVQRLETERFGNEGQNMFMIVALIMVSIALIVISLSFREEREQLKETAKKGWLLALLCGVANGLTNYLVLYLNTRLPASVMFPVISAVDITLIFLYSTLVCKERFNRRQQLGFLLGVISIVLLNL